MSERNFLANAEHEFRRMKSLADGALAQVDEAAFLRGLDAEGNSIAVLVKHVAGNQRSRWTDFLSSDGEKPDRHRDREFIITADDDPASLRARWEEGWATLFAALAPLSDADLTKTITIRGEAHTLLQAVQRQISHYGYHVGQIVFLARHWVGDGWRSLSVPRGESEAFSAKPDPYLDSKNG